MDALTKNLLLGSQYENWGNQTGERTRMEYYTGVEAGNPSGNTSNIKYIFFESLDKRGNWIKNLQKELAYDGADNLLSSTAVRN